MTIEEALLKKFNIAATYSGHAPTHMKLPELARLIDSSAKQAQHIFLGEPHFNGMSLKTYELLAQNPEIFRAAAKRGIRHFCPEFPSEFQSHVDAYAEGKISRKELHYNLFEDPKWHYVCMTLAGDAVPQFQESFLDTIDNAQAAGMTVHLGDVTSALSTFKPPAEITDLGMELVKRHATEKSQVPILQYITDYFTSLPAAERDRLDKIYDDFQTERRNERMDDTRQYQYLRRRIPTDEGILGVVGLGHLDNSGNKDCSITRFLRQEGAEVTCIELFDERNSQDFLNELYTASGWVKRNPPNYTIILQQNELLDRNQRSISWPPAFSEPSVS
jgi:hypothetical protein